MRVIHGLCAALALAGCATEIKVPVTGRIGKDVAFGYAIGRLQGESIFTIDTAKGLRCEGTYDALDRSPRLERPFRCNDGRAGTVTIVRNPDLLNGIAYGVLPDGKRAQFVFGKDERYEDRFDAEGRPRAPAPE